MRDDILHFLRRHPAESFSINKIGHHLKLSKHRFKELKAELSDLIREGKIILDREQNYAARDESRVLKGSLRLHRDGFAFFTPESKTKEDVFVPARFMGFAMNGDEVLVESTRNKRDGRYEGRVIQVVKRANELVVGTLELLGHQHFVRFKDTKSGLDEIYIPQKNLADARPGDLVVVKILQYPGHRITAIGEIQSVVGGQVDEKTLAEALLIQNGIARAFPDGVKRELESLPDEVTDVVPEGRMDLRDLPIITIDGITARDFDDAVCVLKRGKTYILYVSIADVSEYVRAGSALDREAFKRSTSTYLPDECIPMLPEKLSNGLCSLNPFVPRLTLTCEIHYTERFEFVQAQYYKSIIRSHKRATYEEVEAWFDGTGGEEFTAAVRHSLDLMKILSAGLIKKAEDRGTMGFDLPEANIVHDAQGQVIAIGKKPRLFSHKLIEQFMVGANVAVAQYFSVHDLPQIYRVHDKPDPVKMQNFVKLAKDLGLGKHLEGFHPAEFFRAMAGSPLETYLQTVFLRSLKQAYYDPDNIGHYGLMLDDYAHFTSPIRRYPDLIVHRQLKSLLDQTKDHVLKLTREDLYHGHRRSSIFPLYKHAQLVEFGRHTSARERAAMEAERGVTDIKRAYFIRKHVGEKFYGVVTKLTKYGIVIELDPHYVEGFLPYKDMTDDYYNFDEKKLRLVGQRTRRTIHIGDRLWVIVAEVDVETAKIELKTVDATKRVPDRRTPERRSPKGDRGRPARGRR